MVPPVLIGSDFFKPVKKQMYLLRTLLFFFASVLISFTAAAQCNTLRPQIDISFNTDQDCAPVAVTQFQVTFYFNAAQDPNEISILYEWNDPANTNTLIDISNGMVPTAGNTAFTANATFTYFDNNGQCSLVPSVSVLINGVICPTSTQTQTAFFWGTDEQANGVVTLDPVNWDVCFGNAIVNARFEDASDFNCNINVEPDQPNRMARHVQFVYGTNHNPAATIRNLTLTDGGPQNLTDAAGNLSNPQTRGLGMPVTGGYFGPVEPIPFPADGPISVTFPMNAPVNAANLVGNRFEVTLFNWNVCNPWNGDAANPNYEDAIVTRGWITIIDAPAPNFVTRDVNNVVTTDFCINETIFMRNLTPNINNHAYTWRFYDDAAGTNLLATRTSFNPQFSYPTGGVKLIRLTATNPSAQTPCVAEYSALVNITPALSADILVTDLLDVPITPDFCQEPNAPLTNFDARFHDNSVGTVTANTRWRWEFYNQSNALIFESPAAGAYSATQLGPFDRVFTTPGIYRVRLLIRDNVTSCESIDEVTVRVFEKPEPAFSFNRVCDGTAVTFSESSTLTSIDGSQIVLWEWDMDYDGVTFTKDPTRDNQRNFTHIFPAAGSHNVALRVTTDKGACSEILAQTVIVDPLPLSTITSDITSGCSVLGVSFTNTAIAGQPDVIDEYWWEVDSGSGFVVDSIQSPTDPGFGPLFIRDFENTSSSNRTFNVRLRTITVNGCETVSAPIAITVNPGPTSGFVSLNYSPFNNNCSPVSVDFEVDNQTQSLNPTDYEWTISDASGIIDQISSGTSPDFTYNFVNNTQLIKDFFITLTATLPTGCAGDSTRTIRVSPVPASAFTITTPVNDCEKMTLHMDATQKGLVEYRWTIFINGVLVFSSTTVGDNFDHTINRSNAGPQDVDVTLVTTNVANCQSTPTTNSVTVPQGNSLTVSFTALPTVQTLPNATVTLTNNTTPGPWTYEWDFGDGTTSTDPNVPSHTYLTSGTYVITLTVKDNDCEVSQSTSVTINPIPPIVDFSYLPPSGCAPLTVTFTNLSQFADPSTYLWSFGDGGTSQAANPTYTYFNPGVYTVSLSASNSSGVVVTETKANIITALEAPIAQFAVYPQVLDIPGDILYTNNKSIDADTYYWDFGDGATSTSFEPQHKYTEEGEYEIFLVAYNDNGCLDTARLAAPVKTVLSGQLLIPNAFKPNPGGPGSGDKMNNEVFIPLMQRVTKFQMYIFNRWGTMMFESHSQESGWDGYYQGKLCQQDVYIYKIQVEYDDGRQLTKTGDINLIR
jgi:gliding motility-associated-like protein